MSKTKKEPKMAQEIAKNEQPKVPAPQGAMDMGEWGAAPITAKDIVIPRILLMQPGSDLVTEGNAAFGDVINSMTGEKIGDLKNMIQVIPFALKKAWVEYVSPEKKDDEKVFLRVYPITPENEDLPYEGEGLDKEGKKKIRVSRDATMNFYVLLPSEIDRGGEIPYILTFRRMALKHGKKLSTQMYITNLGSKLPPPGLMVTIKVKKESNNKGTWCEPDVLLSPEFTKRTPDSYMNCALKWFKTINSGSVKEDTDSLAKDTGEVSEEVTSGPAKF